MTKTYYIRVTLADGKDAVIVYDSEFKRGTTQHYIDFLRQVCANSVHLAITMTKDYLMAGAQLFKDDLDDDSIIRI